MNTRALIGCKPLHVKEYKRRIKKSLICADGEPIFCLVNTNQLEKEVSKFAAQHDCAVFTDSDGFVALQQRGHSDDGILMVRQTPDAVEFHSVSDWETAITANPAHCCAWIC